MQGEEESSPGGTANDLGGELEQGSGSTTNSTHLRLNFRVPRLRTCQHLASSFGCADTQLKCIRFCSGIPIRLQSPPHPALWVRQMQGSGGEVGGSNDVLSSLWASP